MEETQSTLLLLLASYQLVAHMHAIYSVILTIVSVNIFDYLCLTLEGNDFRIIIKLNINGFINASIFVAEFCVGHYTIY